MLKLQNKIQSTALLPQSYLAHPLFVPETMRLSDPANLAMINLEYIIAGTVKTSDSILNNLLIDKVSKEHLLFVTNEKNHILGIITAEEIHGEKPYLVMQQKNIKRAEITVNMVMIPYQEVYCIEVENIKKAKISHLVISLLDSKKLYALVVEKDENRHIVKGFFWASLIANALGSNILEEDSKEL